MIRIFTDLAANLPAELVSENGLGMVPVVCDIDGEPLDLTAGFDGSAFYGRMRAGAETRTAMPSYGTFLEIFTAALERGEDVIYVAMSGGISGTAALAESVAAELREQYPARSIAVIDSLGASLGQGLPVLRACRLRDEGYPFDEIVRRTEEDRRHMWQVFTVDDLRHLKRTGRLFSAAVKVTNLLNVKPILFGDPDGHIVLRCMNVGRRRSLDTLAARYRDRCEDKTAPVGIAHADCEDDARYLEEKLRAAGCTGEIMTVLYEPVTGSHVGPGTVALFFYGPDRRPQTAAAEAKPRLPKTPLTHGALPGKA